MKLICSKANLLKGVNIVSKAVPSKTTMSILECILIDASANEIKFTANDMELGIETIVEGEILEKGIIAIDAKVFSEIIRKLPDNEVTIESDSNYQISIFVCSDTIIRHCQYIIDSFLYNTCLGCHTDSKICVFIVHSNLQCIAGTSRAIAVC